MTFEDVTSEGVVLNLCVGVTVMFGVFVMLIFEGILVTCEDMVSFEDVVLMYEGGVV